MKHQRSYLCDCDPASKGSIYPIPEAVHARGQIYWTVACTGPEMDSWRLISAHIDVGRQHTADERWVDRVDVHKFKMYIKKCVSMHAYILLHVCTCTCSFSYTPARRHSGSQKRAGLLFSYYPPSQSLVFSYCNCLRITRAWKKTPRHLRCGRIFFRDASSSQQLVALLVQ